MVPLLFIGPSIVHLVIWGGGGSCVLSDFLSGESNADVLSGTFRMMMSPHVLSFAFRVKQGAKLLWAQMVEKRFRNATAEELSKLAADEVCAICLKTMMSAKR